jgi:hypothetical protein
MYDQVAHLFKYDGDIGITLVATVAASMKDAQYQVEVAITKDKLLACKCQCKASGSSKGDERVLCVHILPVLLNFTMFLVNGLSQNILIELSHRWDDELESSFTVDEIDTIRESILLLIKGSNGVKDEVLKLPKHRSLWAACLIHLVLELRRQNSTCKNQNNVN